MEYNENILQGVRIKKQWACGYAFACKESEFANAIRVGCRMSEDHMDIQRYVETRIGKLYFMCWHLQQDELIINADNKLYQAKRNGKNQVIC